MAFWNAYPTDHYKVIFDSLALVGISATWVGINVQVDDVAATEAAIYSEAGAGAAYTVRSEKIKKEFSDHLNSVPAWKWMAIYRRYHDLYEKRHFTGNDASDFESVLSQLDWPSRILTAYQTVQADLDALRDSHAADSYYVRVVSVANYDVDPSWKEAFPDNFPL